MEVTLRAAKLYVCAFGTWARRPNEPIRRRHGGGAARAGVARLDERCYVPTVPPMPRLRAALSAAGTALLVAFACGASPKTASRADEPARCAEHMVLVPRPKAPFCIDRYEASIERRSADRPAKLWPGNQPVDDVVGDIAATVVPGRKPQGYISGEQATLACARAGKRLCTEPEWVLACRGAAGTRYPYGNRRTAGLCNDRFTGLAEHPVPRLFRRVAPPGSPKQLMWTLPWVNDPRLHELSHTVSATGAFPKCVSDFGVYDMVGNLHEWVADPSGVFRGGYFMDTRQKGEGCAYRTTAHAFNHHDYSTGFRCCAAPIASHAGDRPKP
jgi:formylglycine-generating enzyme required for sulfatase activity